MTDMETLVTSTMQPSTVFARDQLGLLLCAFVRYNMRLQYGHVMTAMVLAATVLRSGLDLHFWEHALEGCRSVGFLGEVVTVTAAAEPEPSSLVTDYHHVPVLAVMAQLRCWCM